MIPHTIVLRPEVVVHKLFDGYYYWGCPLRRKWEEGEKEDFHPTASSPWSRGSWR